MCSRTAGTGCPYCSGRFATETNNLASKYPELLREWDEQRNSGLAPADFAPNSSKKVWWRCANGHRWQAIIVVDPPVNPDPADRATTADVLERSCRRELASGYD